MKVVSTFFKKSPLLQRGFLALCAGVLLGIGFPFASLWALSILGSALFVALCITAQKGKEALLLGWITGMVAYSGVFASLIFGIFPFDWYGISNPFLQALAVGSSFLYVSGVLSLSFALFAYTVGKLYTRTWFDVLLIPSLWVLCEWIGSFLHFVFLYGPGSFFGPHFTMGYVGYLLAADPVLLQLASIGGIYLLSFVVVCLGTLLALWYIEPKMRKQYTIVLAALFCLWMVAPVWMQYVDSSSAKSSSSLSVAVMSRYMLPTSAQTPEFREDRYQELLALITPLRDVDLIVFPENATFVRTLRTKEETDLPIIRAVSSNAEGPVLIDSEDFLNDDDDITSNVWFYQNGKAAMGSKQFLMHFGEYLPYAYHVVLRFFADTDAVQRLIQNRSYVPGDVVPLQMVNGIRVAVRLCDEIMSPVLYHTQVVRGAEVLVSISSLSWFQGSPVVYDQMQRIAKVRAVENGRWFIQATNMGPAFVLNDKGEVVAETTFGNREVLSVQVPALTHRTPYTSFGFWILFLLAILVSMGSYISRKS